MTKSFNYLFCQSPVFLLAQHHLLSAEATDIEQIPAVITKMNAENYKTGVKAFVQRDVEKVIRWVILHNILNDRANVCVTSTQRIAQAWMFVSL